MVAASEIVNNFLQGWDSGCPTPSVNLVRMKVHRCLRSRAWTVWRHDNGHANVVDFQRVATIVTLKLGGRGAAHL
jgi:hypothetical protein